LPNYSSWRLGDGLPAWQLRDLRRTFGTTLAELEAKRPPKAARDRG